MLTPLFLENMFCIFSFQRGFTKVLKMHSTVFLCELTLMSVIVSVLELVSGWNWVSGHGGLGTRYLRPYSSAPVKPASPVSKQPAPKSLILKLSFWHIKQNFRLMPGQVPATLSLPVWSRTLLSFLSQIWSLLGIKSHVSLNRDELKNMLN